MLLVSPPAWSPGRWFPVSASSSWGSGSGALMLIWTPEVWSGQSVEDFGWVPSQWTGQSWWPGTLCPVECMGQSAASPEVWTGQSELLLDPAGWSWHSAVVLVPSGWRGHPWSPAAGCKGQLVAPEGWIGHSVRGSVSFSAGPLVVCVVSGRWSREEVRRKPVARLLKDVALMNETKRETGSRCICLIGIHERNKCFYYCHDISSRWPGESCHYLIEVLVGESM